MTTSPDRDFVLRIWLFAAALMFVGLAGTNLPARFVETRWLAQGAALVGLAVWAVVRFRHARLAFPLAFAVAIASLTVVSAFSRDPLGSLQSPAMALGFAMLFQAARDVGRFPILRSVVATGILWALTGWLAATAAAWLLEKSTWIALGGGVPPLDSNSTLVWGSTNVPPWLVLLGIGLLPSITRNRMGRIVIALFALSAVVVVPLSQGRAGWAGLSVAFVLYLAWLAWRGRCSLRLGTRAMPVSPVAIVAVGGVGAAAVLLAGVATGALDSRVVIWKQALGIFLSDPITGGGPNTFSWLRLEHVESYADPTVVEHAHNLVVEHAHNLVLQTLADGGLLLLTSLLMVLGWFCWQAWQHRDSLADGHVLGLAVLSGFGVASTLDHLSAYNTVFGLVVIIAAWSLPSQVSEVAPVGESGQGWLQRWISPLFVAAALVVAAPSVLSVNIARTQADIARTHFRRGELPAAIDAFQAATRTYPGNAGYWLGLGLSFVRTGNTVNAAAAFGRAADLSRGDPRPWGAIADLAADANAQISYLRAAAERSHGDVRYSLRLGQLLLPIDRSDAIRQLSIAVMLDPTTYFTIPDPRARQEVLIATSQMFAELGERARRSLAQVENDLALAAGELPADDAPAWQAVWFAEQGDTAAATDALAVAADAHPREHSTWSAFIAVGRLLCEPEIEERGASMLGLVASMQIAADWDPLYGERGLGDYQPVIRTRATAIGASPGSMVPAFHPCGEEASRPLLSPREEERVPKSRAETSIASLWVQRHDVGAS